MGYLPKHIKVQRQQRVLRNIAMAALAGWTIAHHENVRAPLSPYYNLSTSDGRHAGYFSCRASAARVALEMMAGGYV